ncbi:MAG TPA: nucleotidyltransferase domain-containing protein [Bacteroidia bacterium]|nr:nucleotidyltransferase domain-containing protein [Bacteroidia bacterium]
MNSETNYLDIAKKIILNYIEKDNYAVFLFGSRASGKANRTSDIDVGIIGKNIFPPLLKAKMKEELEESIIPYHVDIIDFSEVSENFKKIALQKFVAWNKPKNIAIN